MDGISTKCHGTDHGELVGLLGQHRQMLAHLNPGRGGVDRLELTAHLRRGIRLHIQSVQMGRTSLEEKNHTRPGTTKTRSLL